jgi:hypothetical protein
VPETLGSVIDYVTNQLQGFTTDNPMYGTLTQVAQDEDLELVIELPAQSEPVGVVEIGAELIHIGSYDADTHIATVPAWGRAQMGTTATAHALGSKVTVNPRFPRNRVALVINQVIQGMCPPLFGVEHDEVTVQTLQWDYALPTGTRNLLRVEWRPYDSSSFDWTPVRSAYIKRTSGAPLLHLPDALTSHSGSAVRFTVATNPTALTDEADLFTDSGLPESCIDIVSLGAIPRLITTAELARQQLTSVEVSERSTLVPASSGTAVARFYMQQYEARLESEAMRLRQEYPLTMMRNM